MPWRIPNDAERTYAEQAVLDRNDLGALVQGIAGDGVITGCEATAQVSPNMTVAVAAGSVQIGGARVTVASGNVTVTAADATNPRIDLVQVDNTGVKAVKLGSAQPKPLLPDPDANNVMLAEIALPATATAITTAMVTSRVVNTARLAVRANSAGTTYARRRINFIPGTNVTSITVADDPANEETALTFNAGGGGAGGIGPEWIVVAGQGVNATVKARADYICTGTADQTIMQNALNALPDNNGTLSSYTGETQGGGGIVFIGLFNMTAGIVCNRDHVEISGKYGSTIFNVITGFPNSTAVISVNRDAQLRPCYFVNIHDIRIIGNSIGTGIIGFDLMTTRSRHDRLLANGLTGDGIVSRGNLSPRWAGNSNEYTYCLVNGCTGWGWNMRDYSEDNRMSGCEFFSNTSGGIRVAGSAWLFSHMFMWGNLGPGMLITGATARIHLSQVKFEQNNGGLYVGQSAFGTYPSEVVCSACQWGSNSWTTINTTDDIQIVGAGGAPTGLHLYDCYWDNPYAGQQARYGINYINGDIVRVLGGRMTSSFGTGQINFGSSTAANFAINNLSNYNPLGIATIALTASPMTITAGHSPEVIYVRSGTVTSITKGGNQIAAATNFAVSLDPGETCVITYTGTPVLWRDRK